MAVVRVVEKSEIWSTAKLFYNAGLLGTFCCCLFCLLWIKLEPIFTRQAIGWLAAAILIVTPCVLFECFRYQIGSSLRAFVLGCGYGIGVGLLVLLEVSLRIMSDEYALAASMIGGYLCISLLFGLLTLAAWSVLRHRRTSVVIQDGTLCPNCAYSLVDNESGRCPECGHPVPWRQNGIQESQRVQQR